MQHPLEARADRIRLPITELAGRAHLNVHTVHKVFNGSADPRLSTIEALETALVAEELALLAHLLRLHPHASPAALLAPAAPALPEAAE